MNVRCLVCGKTFEWGEREIVTGRCPRCGQRHGPSASPAPADPAARESKANIMARAAEAMNEAVRREHEAYQKSAFVKWMTAAWEASE